MADLLDDELLALADGDTSEEEQGQQEPAPSKALSPPSPTTPPTESKRKGSGPSAGKSGATNRVGRGKPAKGGRNRDGEEDNQQSRSSSRDSMASVAMSESDGDASRTSDGNDDGVLFPIDGKFYSEKDKAEVMAMNQLEREGILAERAETVQRRQQDSVLKRLYHSYNKTGDQKKRKAGSADIDEASPRKSSRQKTTLGGRKVGETSDAMEAYKRQREQRGAIAEQRKTDAAARKARKSRGSGSDVSDADADGESDVDWQTRSPAPKHEAPPPLHEAPVELKDFERIKLGRANFAEVCFFPGFEETIKDCYARVLIGINKDTNEQRYRMVKIKGFAEDKPYAIEGKNGKPFITNQYIVAQYGKSEKLQPFIVCSMQPITGREYDSFKGIMSSDGFVLPSKTSLAKKSYDIGNLLHRSWTEAELQEKLRRSGVLKQKFSSLERTETLARLEEARLNKNEERIVELEVKLKALDGPKLAFGTSLVKKSDKPKEKTQQQRLGELNAINRKLNTQNVRRAQLAERKDEAKQRAAIERGEATANPFARVKTYAKTHHKVEDLLTVPGQKKEHDPLFDGSDNSRQATPMSGVDTPKLQNASPAPVRLVTPVKSGKSGVYSRRPHDDEVLASIDIELDIDVF